MKVVRYILTFFLMLDGLCVYCQPDFDLMGAKAEFYKNFRLSQSYHDKVQLNCNSIAKDILVWELRDTIIINFNRVFCDSTNNELDSIKLDTVFSLEDKVYMYDQFRDNLTSSGIWVDYGSWKIVDIRDAKISSEKFWEFSVPLFSKSFDKCIVKERFNMGSGRGYRTYLILAIKTKNGKWIESAKLNSPEF